MKIEQYARRDDGTIRGISQIRLGFMWTASGLGAVLHEALRHLALRDSHLHRPGIMAGKMVARRSICTPIILLHGRKLHRATRG